jgi:Mg2+-importing ATPase
MAEQTPEQFWSLDPDSLLKAMGSSRSGLSSAEAQARLERHGPNQLRARPRLSALGLFLNQFKSPLVLILLFATGVSAVTGDWVEALIILFIVLGSTVLGFVQEYRAGNAVERLRARVASKTVVLRDGSPRTIPSQQVVPGDIFLLSAGSLIPADGILLEAQDFYVNQAVLTGETFPVEKRPGLALPAAGLTDRTNCVFTGTNVGSGSARALSVLTGLQTAFGQIARRLAVRHPETEFERGVRQFGAMLSRIMLVLVLTVLAVNVYFDKPVLDSLLFSVALAVGLTPELLPAIISVTLSAGSRAMAKEGVIVRRLNAIENFGSMDVLCTDKTGTLTAGVVKLDGAFDLDGRPSETVLGYAYLNAKLQSGLANPLDEAILATPVPNLAEVTKLDEIPFDFVRKRLSVVIQLPETRRMLTKGALEDVLAVCTRDAHGPLAEATVAGIRDRFLDWSRQGFRVLGVAWRDLPDQADYTRTDEVDLTFAGFLLFFEPPKPDVAETIEKLSSMGITLKVITGDNLAVAVHVAEQIGLQISGTLTGAELNDMGDEALWQKVETVNLFAEVDPNQKERIILALRKMGHVVGYLGDGINDAPPLHAADVGLSVDSAVDVAKEAADFVLLAHDLSVLERGVTLGRRTFANTLKYVYVTTSANFGNMFSVAGASLFLPFLPMLPVQILLANFLTDFPALGISSDRVDSELVERPRRWNVAQIRNFMFTFGGVSSVFDYLAFGFLILVVRASAETFRTGWFIESVMTELAVMLVIRTRRPFFRSRVGRALGLASVAVAGVALLIPYLPFGRLIGLTPLAPTLLLTMLGITALYVLATEATKRVFYRRASLKYTAPRTSK